MIHPCSNRLGLLISAAAAVALSFASAAPVLAAGNAGSVTGTVNSASGPLAGATVTAAGKSATTDALGHYTLSNVSAGTQTVLASKSLYTSATTTVIVVRRQTVTAPTLTLQQSAGTISGTVISAATGGAITGATVTVSGSAVSAVTDSYGMYTLSPVASGAATVSASANGYQAASQSVSVATGVNTQANFALATAASTGAGSLIPWNGGNWYVPGGNLPWYNYGTDFGTGGWGKYTDWAGIASQFAAYKNQGVKAVRWFVFADGRYSPDWNADGTVLGLDSSFMTDVDNALKIAHDNGIVLILCLADFHMWGSVVSSNGVSGGGHAAVITNSTVQQTYLDRALRPMLQHVAASPYKSSVLAYDIVNEPEWTIKEVWNGALPLAQVQTFVRNCASYIHAYGGGGYATLGAGMPGWTQYWKGMGLDLYQAHYYPNYDSNGPGSGLPTYASLNLDKPCLIGEFQTSQCASYNLGDTTPLSAQWYMDAIYSKGYAGALAWSLTNVDSYSSWTSTTFQTVFTSWTQAHAAVIGPR